MLDRRPLYSCLFPFLEMNGDHGELSVDVRDDIQAILWKYGYAPAQQMLAENGATREQVERARLAKKRLFSIVEPDDIVTKP